MKASLDSSQGNLSAFGGGTMLGATAAIRKGDVVFQRYALNKVLGVGGMGVVWLAHDQRLDQEVALKFVPEALSHDPDAILDLKNQTKLGYKLTHDNIVRVMGFENEDRLAAIVMEYVDGPTLAAMRVDQPAQVFEADSLHVYMLHILDALEYAHEQAKIVHRDLKCANVMVNSEDRVKVADFGIACSLRNSVDRVMSLPQRTGSGTLHYMSPQQLLGGPACVADDIYSLGATIFELMAGTPPFYSGDIGTQIREIPAPAMMARRQQNNIEGEIIPEAWEEVVAAALAKEPSLRPSSAAELRKGLLGQSFKRGKGSGLSHAVPVRTPPPAHAPLPVPSPQPPTPPQPREAHAVSMTVLIFAVVLVLATLTTVVMLMPKKAEPAPAEQAAKDQLKPLIARLTLQQTSAETFEKSDAAIASKREKWEQLLADVRLSDYSTDATLRDIARHAQDRADIWKDKEAKAQLDYHLNVQNLRSQVEATHRDTEKTSMGAAAKAAAWSDLVVKFTPLFTLVDDATEHVGLLDEARKQTADWQQKATSETPTALPDPQLVFARSQADKWAPEGKKKLLQAVQTALTQKGHTTGAADGTWSYPTFQALLAWQSDEKLPTTGVLDYATLERLGLLSMTEPVASSKPAAVTASAPAHSSEGSSSRDSDREPSFWERAAREKMMQSSPGGLPFPGFPHR